MIIIRVRLLTSAAFTKSEIAMQNESNKHDHVLAKIGQLYGDLFEHDGYGDIRIEMKILRRGQKEVIVHCGKQYRYVVDYQAPEAQFPKSHNG